MEENHPLKEVLDNLFSKERVIFNLKTLENAGFDPTKPRKFTKLLVTRHSAIPGYVYGGLIASLIDCHATGTAAAASYRAENREMDSEPPFRFLTASLKVDYLRPTPIDCALELRAQVKEIKGRKVIVSVTLSVKGEICAKGEVVTVQMPKRYLVE